jgi:hypothetical protein
VAQRAEGGWFRLVERSAPWTELPRTRGGAAYYSFATRSPSYDDEPDISLEQGRLSVGFFGACTGVVCDLGELRLADAMQRGPTWGTEPEFELAQLSIDYSGTNQQVDSKLREYGSKVPRNVAAGAKAVEGHSYLVRSIVQDHHDLLVVCEVLRLDEFGCVIAWQQVKSWPVPRER